MKLARYNQYLWAVIGTMAFFLIGMELISQIGWRFWGSNGPNLEIVPGTGEGTGLRTAAGSDPAKQRLLFCDVVDVEGSTVRFIPVAVVNATDADDDVRVYGLSSMALIAAESPGWEFTGCEGPRFNVVVWNASSDTQHLLLDEPRPITGLITPDQKCHDGEGFTSCDHLLWKIHSTDSNGDGRIGFDDAEALFVSDLGAGKLTQVSPDGMMVIEHGWRASLDSLWLRVRADKNGDGKYDARDGSELYETSFKNPAIAQPIVDAGVRKSLDEWIR